MNKCNVIAIDLAKLVFQVCIMTIDGTILLNKTLKRNKLADWLARCSRPLCYRKISQIIHHKI